MGADGTETLDELLAEAGRWGKSLRAVQAAVSEGLLPKAERHGRGRGLGVEWRYPSGSTRALSALCRLQARGYRGDGLRFALWWLGLRPWSPAVSSYVAAVFEHASRSLRADAEAELRRAGVTTSGVGDLHDEPDVTLAD